MASDLKPSTWLGAGYTVDTGAHTVKLTTITAGSNQILTLLTDAHADPTTGDIRYVMWAMIEAFFAAVVAQGSGNASTKMTLNKSFGSDGAGSDVTTYQFSIKTAMSTAIPSE